MVEKSAILRQLRKDEVRTFFLSEAGFPKDIEITVKTLP